MRAPWAFRAAVSWQRLKPGQGMQQHDTVDTLHAQHTTAKTATNNFERKMIVQETTKSADTQATAEEGCPSAKSYRFMRADEICATAAENGHLGALQWARRHQIPWDERTCAAAAKSGHFGVLRWARENGCPWDARTCLGAVRAGSLELLCWAVAQGCPWDWRVGILAGITGRGEISEWVAKHAGEGVYDYAWGAPCLTEDLFTTLHGGPFAPQPK